MTVRTTGCAGTGKDFVHPAMPSFYNPIIAVYAKTGEGRMKFETLNGEVSVHEGSDQVLVRKEISPPESKIAKIQVWYHPNYIRGIKFIDNEGNTVLEQGMFDFDMQEIPLQDGERLVGI